MLLEQLLDTVRTSDVANMDLDFRVTGLMERRKRRFPLNTGQVRKSNLRQTSTRTSNPSTQLNDPEGISSRTEAMRHNITDISDQQVNGVRGKVHSDIKQRKTSASPDLATDIPKQSHLTTIRYSKAQNHLVGVHQTVNNQRY